MSPLSYLQYANIFSQTKACFYSCNILQMKVFNFDEVQFISVIIDHAFDVIPENSLLNLHKQRLFSSKFYRFTFYTLGL